MSSDKTRTTRVRRAAQRQGISLSLSRRRDPRALDYGTWTLDDPRRSQHLTGLSLDQVERYLLTGAPDETTSGG